MNARGGTVLLLALTVAALVTTAGSTARVATPRVAAREQGRGVASSLPGVSRTPEPAEMLVRFEVPGPSIASRYPVGRSITFRYPANWHVTRRRLDNVTDPRTVFAVASYAIPRRPPDDCIGTYARGRPIDGTFLLLTEILDGASLRRSLPALSARPRHFQLPTSGRVMCLPPVSQLFQFRVGARAFYLWLSIGPKASTRTRDALIALLDGMWIAAYRKT